MKTGTEGEVSPHRILMTAGIQPLTLSMFTQLPPINLWNVNQVFGFVAMGTARAPAARPGQSPSCQP